MTILRGMLAGFICLWLWACGGVKESQVVARIGNAGSTTGPHSIQDMRILDTQGGGAGFSYGAISSYPGKSADIGRVGVPAYIEGYWAKKYASGTGFETYYRISAPMDSDLAAQKIKVLQGYYQHYTSIWGIMQVVVDGPRVRVFYTLKCYDHRFDCSPRANADPHGWVVSAPDKSTEVVVLFDGEGEMSLTPFAGSPYDKMQRYREQTAGEQD